MTIAPEIVSTALIVAGALAIIAMERRWPYVRGQRFFREGFFDDFVLYTLIQSSLLGLVIARIVAWIDASTHLSRWHVVRDLPLAVQAIAFFVVHDFYIYWFHRAQHASPVLFRLHEAHHSPREVDWLSGSRSHAFEILINQTIEYAPIALLARPEIALFKGVLDAVWGMWIHSNVDVRSGALQKVINGPEMHRWHHASGARGGGFNFATKLALWDWIFGTAVLPEKKPKRYGLADEGYPRGFLAQQGAVFRARSRSR
jgi:sterol desaturase/sphingolipid hydroxylase (fatty acid hydroxylase superfamily)